MGSELNGVPTQWGFEYNGVQRNMVSTQMGFQLNDVSTQWGFNAIGFQCNEVSGGCMLLLKEHRPTGIRDAW